MPQEKLSIEVQWTQLPVGTYKDVIYPLHISNPLPFVLLNNTAQVRESDNYSTIHKDTSLSKSLFI